MYGAEVARPSSEGGLNPFWPCACEPSAFFSTASAAENVFTSRSTQVMRSGPTTPPSLSFSVDTLLRSRLVTNEKFRLPPSSAWVRRPVGAVALAVPFLSGDGANGTRLTVHFEPPWQLLHLPAMNCARPAATAAVSSVDGAWLL